MPLVIDWLTIKSEYISTQISTRALAQKHGVSYSTLEKRARKEGWVSERGRIVADAWQKTAEATTSAKVDAMTSILECGDKVLALVNRRLDEMDQSGKIRSNEIKAITEILKMLRDIYRADAGIEDDPLRKARELLAGVPDILN